MISLAVILHLGFAMFSLYRYMRYLILSDAFSFSPLCFCSCCTPKPPQHLSQVFGFVSIFFQADCQTFSQYFLFRFIKYMSCSSYLFIYLTVKHHLIFFKSYVFCSLFVNFSYYLHNILCEWCSNFPATLLLIFL